VFILIAFLVTFFTLAADIAKAVMVANGGIGTL